MTDAEIRKLATDILSEIAPDADTAALTGTDDIRETLDLDSMDFLNFVIALNKHTGIDIPERD